MFRRMIRDIRKADGGDHDVVEEADRLRQSWAVLRATCFCYVVPESAAENTRMTFRMMDSDGASFDAGRAVCGV